MRFLAYSTAALILAGAFLAMPAAKAAVAPHAGLTAISSDSASPVQDVAVRHHHRRHHRHHHHD